MLHSAVFSSMMAGLSMLQQAFASLARMALVFTGLAGTQRQIRIVVSLGFLEIATFPQRALHVS